MQIERLLDEISHDLSELRDATLPLVGALVAGQEALPMVLRQWIMHKLSARVDMAQLTPAAQAVLRISQLSPMRHEPYAQEELRAQIALIRVLRLQPELDAATTFLKTLAQRLENNLGDL